MHCANKRGNLDVWRPSGPRNLWVVSALESTDFTLYAGRAPYPRRVNRPVHALVHGGGATAGTSQAPAQSFWQSAINWRTLLRYASSTAIWFLTLSRAYMIVV